MPPLKIFLPHYGMFLVVALYLLITVHFTNKFFLMTQVVRWQNMSKITFFDKLTVELCNFIILSPYPCFNVCIVYFINDMRIMPIAYNLTLLYLIV